MLNQQIQNYKIISLLGEGGMANVYLAVHTALGGKVAIKLLKDEFVRNNNIRKRFLAEAKLLHQLAHNNLVKVVDLIDAGDIVAFVMEYIEGESFNDFLAKKGQFQDTEIGSIFNQMLNSVAYIHDKGLIHRDIKPSNFMVTKDGNIKLLDFGIAKNTNTGSSEYTQTGAYQMGTPLYMSPEQIKNTSEVTKTTDIYSLGIVLWQMITRRKPYNAENLSLIEIQIKIFQEPLELTKTSWDKLIQKATNKEPNKRFSNIKEFKDDIEKILILNSKKLVKNKPTKERKINFYWYYGIALIVLLFIIIIPPYVLDSDDDGIKNRYDKCPTKYGPIDGCVDYKSLTSLPYEDTNNYNLKIGQKHQGGIIFHLDENGVNGKVCTGLDLGDFNWENANESCNQFVNQGYSDWYMPSKEELNSIYENHSKIGEFSIKLYYWSSTKNQSNSAFWQSFFSGEIWSNDINKIGHVRAVRKF